MGKKDTVSVVFQVARSQRRIYAVMMQTMGSLGKENKACREANSPQHVNLGLAEMGCSKSAFLSHQ